MCRFVVVLLALASICARPQSGELEFLKSQFPAHVSGNVTSKSDPLIQRIYSKYEQRVKALTMETLAPEVLDMRRSAENDIFWAEREPKDSDSKMTSSQKHACRQNVSWLKQKFIPYLQRLAQLQRGR